VNLGRIELDVLVGFDQAEQRNVARERAEGGPSRGATL